MTAVTEKEYLYISYLRLQYTCALGIGLWFAVTAYRRNSCIVIAIKFCKIINDAVIRFYNFLAWIRSENWLK